MPLYGVQRSAAGAAEGATMHGTYTVQTTAAELAKTAAGTPGLRGVTRRFEPTQPIAVTFYRTPREFKIVDAKPVQG
jgi:hypothetical protein